MTIATGANAKLRAKAETVYGTLPSGNWQTMPFVSDNYGSSLALVDSPVLGQGREPYQPAQGAIDVTGNIVVPLDVRNIGLWLKHLLGAPVTTGAGPYTHTFTSGAASLPSLALELSLSETTTFLKHAGIYVNTLEIGFDASGSALPQASLGLLGQSEAKAGTTSAGTPTALSYTPFSQFQGSIKREGSVLGNITAASLSYSNGAEAFRVLGSGQNAGGADLGMPAATGNLTARFDSTTLYDDAVAGTALTLDFIYQISASASLTLTVGDAILSKAPLSVSGPGGITAQMDFRGFNAATHMLTAVLVNDVASY